MSRWLVVVSSCAGAKKRAARLREEIIGVNSRNSRINPNPGGSASAMQEASVGSFQTIDRLAFAVQLGRLPGREAALHFHHLITPAGELDTRLRRQMAGLRIAIENVHLVAARALQVVPSFLREAQRAWDVALGEVFRLAHIHDDYVVA